MTTPPLHSVSVAGIVINDRNEVLVIQRRDNGKWEPPGGILELHETFEEGVRREVHEETGITVTVERLTGVYKNMTRGIVALVFRCEPTAGTVAPTPEAANVRWMSLTDVCTAMDSAYCIRVADAFNLVVRARVHDGVRLIEG